MSASTTPGLNSSATIADMPVAGSLSEKHAIELEIRRKIDVELAARYGVFSEGKAIAFTYALGGEIHNIKLRRGKGNMPFREKGKALIFWNVDCLADDPQSGDPLIIAEGEFDALALLQIGYQFVVSVPNGAPQQPGSGDIDPNDDGRFQFLWKDGKLLPELDKFKKIILATDGDGPGHALREELALRLGEHRCDFVIWPEGCKDANDVLINHDGQALRAVIGVAKPHLVDEVCQFDDIPEPGPVIQYSIGWKEMNDHCRFVRPEFVVLTGEPGSGKSQFAKNIICNLAERYGLKTLICAFEERAKPRIQRDLRRYFLRGHESGATPEEVLEADIWINKLFPVLLRRRYEPNDLDWLLARIEYAVKRYEVAAVLIDPWNEIEHDRPGGMTETEYTSSAIMRLKRFADRHNIIIMVVAHPAKGAEKGLYGISGSAHWYNKADHGLIITREDRSKNKVVIWVQKSKDYETMGTPGEIPMQFHPVMSRFEVDHFALEGL
jgi:twinkle protein